MTDGLLHLLDLNASEPGRDWFLRVGAVVGVLGYYAVALFIILRDRNRVGATLELSDADPAQAQRSALRHLLAGICLAGLVAAFPWSYAHGAHWLLIGGGFLVVMVIAPASSRRSLGLRAPSPVTGTECAVLAVLCLTMLGLALVRWQEVPPSLGEDESRFILNGIRIWQAGDHPLHINEAILPGLSDTLHGFFITMLGVDRPRLGLRVYTMLCAVLSIPILYRWICLIERRSTALVYVLLLMTMPFFNYYARVPPGDDLVLAQALFLYGATRCLVAPGLRGPVLGGIALGLAQWNYHPSRLMVLFLLLLPVLAVPYRKQLARGWMLRLVGLGLIALPITLSLRLARGYDPTSWTWYMTPAVLSLKGLSSSWITDLAEWKVRLNFHLDMWFNSHSNLAWVLTVPGSPVAPFPVGALALIGFGILLTQIRSIMVPVICLAFACGLAPSILANASPSGHRAILAEVPFVFFAALGLRFLWPWNAAAGRTVPGRLNALLGAAMMVWGGISGLHYFQIEIWKDPRALHEAHNIEQTLRSERILRDAPRFDIRGSATFGSEELYLADKVAVEPFGFAYWLPVNWATRPLSVQFVTSELPLFGLVKSAFPTGTWEEAIDALGYPAGFGYQTDGLKLGQEEALRQWQTSRRVSGSVMFPSPGRLDVASPGATLSYSTPAGIQTVDGQGTMEVLGGLGWFEMSGAGAVASSPPVVRVRYSAEQTAEEHTLLAADLYRVPIHGWLESAVEPTDPSAAPAGPVPRRIVPTILTTVDIAQPPQPSVGQRIRVYSAKVQLPNGKHPLRLLSDPPCPLRLSLDGKEVQPMTIPRGGIELTLEGPADNGRHVQIEQLVDVPGTQLRLLSVESQEVVPPYDWFTPDMPLSQQALAPLVKPVAVHVEMKSGPQIRIGELTPKDVTFGFMPPVVDATWQGSPIIMHEVTYDHGLGVHAWSRSTYAVPAGAVEFQAVVGLSDWARASGTPEVTFEVWGGHGERLYDSGPVNRDSPPMLVDVPVLNQDSITLVVTNGSNGGDWDHANWGDAAFLLGSR